MRDALQDEIRNELTPGENPMTSFSEYSDELYGSINAGNF
jgi:hypothetical protein